MSTIYWMISVLFSYGLYYILDKNSVITNKISNVIPVKDKSKSNFAFLIVIIFMILLGIIKLKIQISSTLFNLLIGFLTGTMLSYTSKHTKKMQDK